jgi:hypothetical protein
MGKHFEFHFLEAPYIVLDAGQDERHVDAWSSAAVLASRITALESDVSYLSDGSTAKEGVIARYEKEIDEIKSQLSKSSEGVEVSKRIQQGDVEGLVARKTGRSLSRDWVTTTDEGDRRLHERKWNCKQ